MGVVPDIVQSWRNPRGLILGLLPGASEPGALARLMGACGLIFVSEWPLLARQAHLDPTVPLNARIGGGIMGVLFILPLVMYLLAGLSHLIARAGGGRGTGLGARLALFQALLSAAPLFLLNGLVRGLAEPGPGTLAIGLVSLVGFLWIWLNMLIAVERN